MDEKEIKRICAKASSDFVFGVTDENEKNKIQSAVALIEAFLVNQARAADSLKQILIQFRNGA